MSKLWPSTLVCALSIDLEMIPCSIGVSSSMPSRPIMPADPVGAEAAHELVVEGDDRSAIEPGSPWRPERPRSWLSIRRASCRSVPMMCRPPGFGDAGAEHDVGAAPGHVGGDRDRAGLTGARRRSSASRSCCLALSTSCWMPRCLSMMLSRSDVSTETVPTSTGRPCFCISSISSMTALNLAASVL